MKGNVYHRWKANQFIFDDSILLTFFLKWWRERKKSAPLVKRAEFILNNKLMCMCTVRGFDMVWTIQLDYWINLIKHPFQLMNTSIKRDCDGKKRHTKELLNLRVNETTTKNERLTLTYCYVFALMLMILWSSMIGKHWRVKDRGCLNWCQQGTWIIESGFEFSFQQANIVLNKHHSNNNV